VRVVVADDVMLTREGIVRLLRDAEIDVVAQAEDADALLHHVRLTRPDVAIVDIRMPPTHTDEGLIAAQQIRAEHPDILAAIRDQKEISKETGDKLKAAVDKFAKAFA